MKIEAEKYIIEMTYSELWSTAFDVRLHIEESLKRHWINHQDVWKEHEKYSLERLRIMFTALGRIDLYEEIFDTANVIFKEHNNNQANIKT